MTDSTGNGEKKKEKKPGLAATITAVAALLAAGGTLVKDVTGQHEQELLQKSMFNYATAETAEIKERLARLETHIEWLRGGPMEDMMPAMVTQPECATDDDCGVTEHCTDGECIKPVAEEAPAMGGGGGGFDGDGIVEFTPPPPKPEARRRDKPKIEKFEDLKNFVQQEQRPWAAE